MKFCLDCIHFDDMGEHEEQGYCSLEYLEKFSGHKQACNKFEPTEEYQHHLIKGVCL